MTLTTLSSCSGGGRSSRSASAFCTTLRDGVTQLQQSGTGGASPASQLEAALANVGVYTAMLRRLDAAAPPPIAVDMHAALQSWTSQADALSKFSSDPVGAVISGAVSSVLSSASFSAVDKWSRANCNSQAVFGDVSASAGPGSTTNPVGSKACAQTTAAAPKIGTTLTSGTTAAELTAVLGGLRQAPATVAGPIGELGAAINTLTPPPTMALEAVGRLRFPNGGAGLDVDALLTTIDNQAMTACGAPLVGADALSRVKSLTPRPGPDSSVILAEGDDVYGTCPTVATSYDLGFVARASVVHRCGSDISVVDLQTGIVQTTKAVLPDSKDLLFYLTGPAIAWVDTQAVAASGLTAPSWSATLHIRGLHGEILGDSPVVTGVTGPAPSEALTLFPQYAGGHILTEETMNHAIKVRDLTGKVVSTINYTGSGSDILHVTQNLVLFGDSPSVMVDGFKATPVLANSSSTSFSAKSDEGCGTHALVGKPVFGFAPKPDGSTIALEVHDGSSGLTFTALPPSGADVAGLSSGIGLLPTGVASSTSIGSAPLTLQRSDGTTAWSIDTAVVTQAAVLAGHLIVVNPSGERIIVDASSGKQSTNVNTALAAFVRRLPTNIQRLQEPKDTTRPLIAYADPGGSLIAHVGGSYWTYAYNDLCGS